VRPEITYKVCDQLRLTLDYTLSASVWEGDTDEADIEDYPGVDMYSAFNFGIEYTFPLTAAPKPVQPAPAPAQN